MAYGNFKRKTTKRPYRKRSSTMSTMRKVAKQVVLRQAETKRHQRFSGITGFSDVVMPDNASRTLISNCMNLDQGTTDEDVVGTEIIASGIALKLQMRYVGSFAPYFKIFVVEANQSLLTGAFTIFENTIGNGMLDNIKKEYKVLKTIIVNPMLRGIGGGSTHVTPPIFRKLWIPLKKKYNYRTDSLNNGVSKNIAVIGLCYHDGLPTQTHIGNISCYSTLYFKDF